MNKTQIMSMMQSYADMLIEQSTPQAPAWNIEQKLGEKQNKWNYVDGCMITALLSLYEITGQSKYLDFCHNFMKYFVNEDGTINTFDKDEYNLDNINPGKNLFKLYDLTKDQRYRLAMDTVREQLTDMPRTKQGNFWHKKIYPSQVWLDGLYMAQPFYMEYEKRYNNMRGCRDSFLQFENVSSIMKDTQTGLYYHGYDESRQMYWADKATGLSQNFWLRAIGWHIIALVDTLEAMDEQMYHEYRFLMATLNDVIDAVLAYQMPNGMFCQLIAKPDLAGNYCETSGSAIIAYGILKSIRLGFLPKKYGHFAEKAFYGIAEEYLQKGDGDQISLDGICLVAGLGGATYRDGSDEYYLSEPIVKNEAKGSAPMLLCYTELLR